MSSDIIRSCFRPLQSALPGGDWQGPPVPWSVPIVPTEVWCQLYADSPERSDHDFGDLSRGTKGGSEGDCFSRIHLLTLAVLDNYRPVFNLSFLDKIVERALTKQPQGFLDDVSLLDPFQTSSCPSYGTGTVLTTLIDGLQSQLKLNPSKISIWSTVVWDQVFASQPSVG